MPSLILIVDDEAGIRDVIARLLGDEGYRVHTARMVTIPQGKIGYVYARDGIPLPPTQTLGRVTPCNNFQDARAFLGDGKPELAGQRGRQRAILREGVYAINPALFVVITEDAIFTLRRVQDHQEAAAARIAAMSSDSFTHQTKGLPKADRRRLI